MTHGKGKQLAENDLRVALQYSCFEKLRYMPGDVSTVIVPHRGNNIVQGVVEDRLRGKFRVHYPAQRREIAHPNIVQKSQCNAVAVEEQFHLLLSALRNQYPV